MVLAGGSLLWAEPAAPGSRYLIPEASDEVVRLEGGAAHAERNFVLTDFTGREVLRRQARADETGAIGLSQRLPRGYYEITAVGEEGPSTGILALAPVGATDPFFAIDSALSWLTRPEDRRGLIGGLGEIGVGLSRERLSWNAINPAPGRWEWETPRQYDATRRSYEASGVKVLEMFHDAPKWLGAAQGGRFPDDLLGAAASWREVASRWHTAWRALEVWNEPDIVFGGNQPADQGLPLLKTLRYTMRSAGLDTPLVGGAVAYLNRDYLDAAARNGLLDEADAISFHYYGEPLGLEKHVAEMRAWLKAHSAEAKPLWITEIGSRWMGDPALRPSREQQTVTALTFAMDAVEARACGIATYFPFVYVRYNEGQKNFGMLDGAGAPLRSLSAYTQVLRVLSGLSYQGDLAVSEIPSARRIRVFGVEDKASVVVVYTGEIKPEAALTVPFAVKEAWGVDGRALAIGPDGSIPAGDGLVYLRVEHEAVASRLERGTGAARLHELGARPSPALPPPSPVVLQPILDLKNISASSRGYYLPEGAGEIALGLRVYNLSDQPCEVVLKPDAAEAMRVRVVEKSRVEVSLKIKPAALVPGADGLAYFKVEAELAGGGRIPQVILPFIPSQGLQEYLQAASYQFNVPIGELHRWQPNHSPGKEGFAHGEGAAWGLSISFTQKGDRWSYPRFALPQEVELDRVQAVLVRVRAKEGSVKLMTWDDQGTVRHTSYPIVPADGGWHVAYIPLLSFMETKGDIPVARGLRQISVGLNSHEDSAAVELSDLYLLGK